jgi:prepilin-type N-terminal cleavage/methylation domain-containing protein
MSLITSPAEGSPVSDERGFTLIEVMVAAMVLVVGLLALLGMLDVASRTTHTNRVRQQATNVAREVVEDVRALAYSPQLATPNTIATALLPQLSGATQSGSTLTVRRGSAPNASYTFNVTFTSCSLDDPSDGYGDHSSAPASGGSWCPDVASSGTSDSEPDDYKRVSVTVTPTNAGGVAPTYPVQQTVLIYNKPVNGPAVSCLTTSTCPGQNPPPIQTASSVTFNVTTTSPAYEIQWLVNGNPPGSQDPTGANGTYMPNGTTSSFTWTIPTAAGNTIDGIYSISAQALDPSGNAGTRSTLQVTVNEHPVIAPTTFNAGYDQQIGGVDIQWVPSADQDVLYYTVYHKIGIVTTVACSQVQGTSCTDTSAATTAIAPIWPSGTTCQSPPQSSIATNTYWVIGWDRDPATNVPRPSSYQSLPVDADACDHAPNPPSNLTGLLSNGQLGLSWSAPSPADPDSASNGDTITAWRIYRWSPSQGSTPQVSLGNRLALVGAGNGSPFVTTATDASPDPGGAPQDYCVTAVDTHLNESQCSNVWQQ